MMKDSGPRVLLVDDSATIRYAMQNRLQMLGCQVDCVADGGSALAAIQAQPYGMVLLDCFLPDMPGPEVARQVRLLEQHDSTRPYTPLIGISAEADAAHVQRCLDSGMDGTLDKPLQTVAIRRLLALWCDHESGEDGAPATAEEEHSQDLARLFIQTAQSDLQALQQASVTGDAARLGQLTHRMKGAALTMGRAEIVALLECVEEALRADTDERQAIGLLLQSLSSALQARSLQS
ncbi:histidine kinase [Herbaspirillum rubrisubalbicans]|uniref:Histidine kinase n=1 Tax=Herbaspirillum rubrisubalbicans TaxID=80842 RepID=A0ABX9C4D7_9BURK|nr:MULTISPECIES: response regulator [Herbaspirillum]MCP1573513.1 two-component system sensor histidine kinase EvgS [Herbaspirillum rubrisubalbicans]NQE47803.1 histidine kinase [Herbaspirillum rubrisubalbicans]RAM65034.1 histidine kinase [Herbaspirillum rubrisubalbicans]RAN47766.1 histidine kinase [Herbaspirillum rubrisubalbicans]